MKHVSTWMRPTQADSAALIAPAWCEIRHEPRGVTLVIAPFNYPVSLLLGPLISALAAGNTAILKPSEMCPAVAATAAQLIPKYFKSEIVAVVIGGTPRNPTSSFALTPVVILIGGIPQSTALMELTWGLVFFTGSERVGKIIIHILTPTLAPTPNPHCVGKAPPPRLSLRWFWSWVVRLLAW